MNTLSWLLIALALAVPGGISWAAEEPDSVIAEYGAKLMTLRTQIDASAGQREDLVEEYLEAAAIVVYKAKANANMTFGPDITATNDDLTKVVELGYLQEWPANPLNAWEPIKVLKVSDEPSPGDFAFEVCPQSEQTTLRGTPYLGSFNLYVFAFIGQPVDPKRGQAAGGNEKWAHPPSQVLYAFSFGMRSDRKAEEDRALIEKLKAEGKIPAT